MSFSRVLSLDYSSFSFFSFRLTLREMSNTWSPRQSVIPTRNPSLPSFFGLQAPCSLLTSLSQLQHGCKLWSPDKDGHKEHARGTHGSFIHLEYLYPLFFQTGYW